MTGRGKAADNKQKTSKASRTKWKMESNRATLHSALSTLHSTLCTLFSTLLYTLPTPLTSPHPLLPIPLANPNACSHSHSVLPALHVLVEVNGRKVTPSSSSLSSQSLLASLCWRRCCSQRHSVEFARQKRSPFLQELTLFWRR